MRRANLVAALVQIFDEEIAVAEDVDIVAPVADDIIRTAATIDYVIPSAGGDEIVELVTGQGLAAVGRAYQRFDVRGEPRL